MKKTFIFLLMFVFLFSLVSAGMPLFPNPGIASQGFDYIFNFTTASDCSGVLISFQNRILTNQNGFGFEEVDISSLQIVPSFLCEYKNGQLRKVHNYSDMIFDTVYSQRLVSNNWSNVSGDQINNNLNWINVSGETDSLSIHLDGGNSPSANINWGGFNLNNVNNITAINYFGKGSALTLEVIGSPTFSTIQDLQNTFHSSGVFNDNISVNFIILNGGNTFNVTGGSGTIRATENATTTLFFFDWTESNNIPIALDEVIYVGVEWNAGSPQIVTKSSNTWDMQMDFPLGSVIRDVSGMHLQRSDHSVGDHANNMIQRLFSTNPFTRGVREGGLILGTNGRNITMTSGVIWEKLNKFDISAIDTSGSDVFDRYYRDGSGGWLAQTDSTEWNNTHYDDGTGTLNELGNNKFSIEWVYLEVDGEIVTLFGQEEFNNIGDASASSPPSPVPPRVEIHSRLIGRIIFQKDATDSSSTESVFVITFTVAGVTDHGNLAGLTDVADHPYALLIDGSRELTALWNYGSFGINGSGDFNTTGGIAGNTLNIDGATTLNETIITTAAGVVTFADADDLINATGTDGISDSSTTDGKGFTYSAGEGGSKIFGGGPGPGGNAGNYLFEGKRGGEGRNTGINGNGSSYTIILGINGGAFGGTGVGGSDGTFRVGDGNGNFAEITRDGDIIAKNLNVSGEIFIEGDAKIDGILWVDFIFNFSQPAVKVFSNFNVTGNLGIRGNAIIDGSGTFGDDINLPANTNVNFGGSNIRELSGDLRFEAEGPNDFIIISLGQLAISGSSSTVGDAQTVLSVTGGNGVAKSSGTAGIGSFIFLTGGRGGDDIDLANGGKGGDIRITGGRGGNEDAGFEDVAGDGGDIHIRGGIKGLSGIGAPRDGYIFLQENQGGVLIGSTNASKINATNLLYIDGSATALLGWFTPSDRSLKSSVELVDSSLTRSRYKYKLQYDVPIFESFINNETYIDRNDKVIINFFNDTRVIGYEMKTTDRFHYGIMADEIPQEYIATINGNSYVNYDEITTQNYVDIGKILDENIRIKNCAKDNPTDYIKYAICITV